MSRQEQLNLYIGHLQNRLRTFATLRGAAVIAFVALAATLLLTLVLNRYAFPEQEITPARVALYVAVGLAFAAGLLLPLLRVNRRRSIERAEGKFPMLEQRLLTFSERQQTGDPFVELLAGDTLAKVQEVPASQLVPTGMLLALFTATVVFAGAVVWMATAAPGFLGYGASLLWTGPKKIVTPLYDIHVTPGDAAVRRHSDEEITAQLVGLDTRKVTLHARVGTAAAWEAVDMQPQANGQGFGFTLAALPENVEYFVEAGPVRSKHYTVRVVDLPAVKDMKVTYHYPRWTGLPQVSEEHGGDLRALEGTDAELTVTMDNPLRDGMLVLDNGQPLHLTGGEGNLYHGTVRMQKDGAYHVAATDSGQQVRLSEDYFISTEKANPPQVAIERPTADYRASPIEEVTIGVKAGADFGLHSVQLHYSVNGGPSQTVDVLKQSGAKNSNGSTTLNLESFKVVPGDVVSLYATAKDAHEEAKTDISFIQVDPFEREFSQSQQGGGGGGGGGGQGAGNQTDISRREKELIAATWKQQNDKASTASHSADIGKTLSEAQATLRQQVLALSARMESRDLSSANEEFTGFEKEMQAAAAAMVPSADKLKQQAWSDAMPNEQKALQALLRAEATFRKIQVAFGQQSGGGGGGGGSAGRDLASLFDLEMDTEKNQYETAQTGSPAEEQAKKVDDALAKLDALAKRQEELAQQQSQQAQNFQQRWQQEMLRREAEQLQREMEQMQAQQRGQQGQSASGQQGSSGQSSGQSGGGQQGQSQQARGQSGSSSGSQSGSDSKDGGADPRVQQALNRLREANEQMRRAAAPGQSGQAGAGQAKAAAERLHEATNLMGGAQKQQATGKLDSLANDASKLQAEEASEAERIRSLAANSNDSARAEANEHELNRLVRDRQQLSDDVSHLQRSMRDTARQLAPTQPAASSKLREALGAMDESDLGNRVQRTADGLRRGINPNANGNEAAIASGLKQLDEGLKQAQSGMGSAPGAPDARKQGHGSEVAALDQLDRLRSTVQSLSPGTTGQPGNRGSQRGTQPGQSGQAQGNGSQQGRQPGSLGSQAGQAGGQSSRPGSQGNGSQASGGQPGQPGQGSGSQPGGQQPGSGSSSSSDRRPSLGGGAGSPGDSNAGGNRVRTGGGGGAATWNVNTGNNTYDRNARAQQPRNAPNPADSERTINQGMQELNRLRQLTHGDPAASREVDTLVKEMQQLEPGRFPGNPQMVEELHQQVLNDVDKLELELRRSANDPALAQVRTTRTATVPQGYGDAVAEYYRRLGKGQ